MDLEAWVIDLLNQIREAGYKDENFDLHLEHDIAKEIASTYDSTKWIEIY
jgi:hypothetical protein